jgi:site-specific DNA recombinase
MTASWNHHEAYYRCRYPAEYALVNAVVHPKTVYVREQDILPPLDRWLARVFDAERLDETLERLVASQRPSSAEEAHEARMVAARKALSEAERRLDRYREALEAGAEPSVVAKWIQEATTERGRAERLLKHPPAPQRVSLQDVRALVGEVGDLVRVIEEADPGQKGELYEGLGLTLTYEPEGQKLVVEADLRRRVQDRVGGGI